MPWGYLAGGAAAATALAFLSNKLYGCLTHKSGVPLPPGPPATWFWGNPMPKQKYVCSSNASRPRGANTSREQLNPPFFRFPSIPHELATLVDQYGPVVSLRRGSHVTIIIGRVDVRLTTPTRSVLRSRPPM